MVCVKDPGDPKEETDPGGISRTVKEGEQHES